MNARNQKQTVCDTNNKRADARPTGRCLHRECASATTPFPARVCLSVCLSVCSRVSEYLSEPIPGAHEPSCVRRKISLFAGGGYKPTCCHAEMKSARGSVANSNVC